MSTPRVFDAAGMTCTKCGFNIGLTENEDNIAYTPDVDHNITPPSKLARLNSWQGRENCKLKGDISNKQDHFLLLCPRCDYIDEVLPLDYTD